MKRFAQLYQEVDRTTRTSEKVGALRAYFEEAPDADAAWALRVLTGKRLRRAVNYRLMRTWAAEVAELPEWLFKECHQAVGDLSETISLVLPDPTHSREFALSELMIERVVPLASLDETEQRELIVRTWDELAKEQRFLFQKLMSGAFRFGAARKLVIRALGEAKGIDSAAMEHRLASRWEATAEDFARLVNPDEADDDPARAYPFYLASPLEDEIERFGDSIGLPSEFLIEHKFDGIRAQLIRRSETLVWSRGEEIISQAFPELVMDASAISEGTVLDGELLAWDDGAGEVTAECRGLPMPFSTLQRRLNRKSYQPTLFDDVPVIFMAYDLLELGGEDIRERAMRERRVLLEAAVRELGRGSRIRLSPTMSAANWSRAAELRARSRELGVEGLMLKSLSGPYRTGRVRGEWWKWKVEPYTIDVVMTAAQPGSGKRASLYTDYTFGVWSESEAGQGAGELVTIAKAYSGLSNQEIKRVDAYVRKHTTGRAGPVRMVEPKLVFELAFEGIAESSRHASGMALRFPRMHRWRHDKQPKDADTLASVRELLERANMRGSEVK
ncbi:MAG: ATP-dependent DNA ligase [Planctomycetota bacterium]